MAKIIKEGWFGRNIAVLISTGKTFIGELTETSENYLVIKTKDGAETQIMVHAIVGIRLAEGENAEGNGPSLG